MFSELFDRFFPKKNWKVILEGKITNPELIAELTIPVEKMPELLRRRIKRVEDIPQTETLHLETIPRLKIEIIFSARKRSKALSIGLSESCRYSAECFGAIEWKVFSVSQVDEAGQ